LVEVLVSHLDSASILGFLETGPDVLRRLGMGQPAQLTFQPLQRARGQLPHRSANDLSEFSLWEGLQFVFQRARRHAPNMAEQCPICKPAA